MTRAGFIKLYADIVAEWRKRDYPDIRPSEAAASPITSTTGANPIC